MEERETGITFGEIFRALRRRLFVVLAATLVLAAALVLLAQFVYNPAKENYSLSFELYFPGGEGVRYPDGTPFYYHELISLESLTEVRDANEEFSGIDVAKMSERDEISVSPPEGEEGGYTLSVRASYFRSRAQATKFLSALASRPASIAVQKASESSYSLDEDAFTGADFEGKLDLLARQREELLAQYDAWTGYLSGNYTVSGKTLANHRAEVLVLFGEALQRALYEELETNGYVPLELRESKLNALRAERAENEQKIAALKQALGDVSAGFPSQETATQPLDLSEELAALIIRNVQIDSQISALTEENIANFSSRIRSEYLKLQSAAASIRSVGVALYEKEARVTFETSRASVSGGIHPALAVIGGLILSLVLVSIVVCAVEIPKSRRRENAAAQGEESAPQQEN